MSGAIKDVNDLVPMFWPVHRVDPEWSNHGGNLHCILADDNVDDYFAQSALDRAKEIGDPDHTKLCELVRACSVSQRRKLIRLLNAKRAGSDVQ